MTSSCQVTSARMIKNLMKADGICWAERHALVWTWRNPSDIFIARWLRSAHICRITGILFLIFQPMACLYELFRSVFTVILFFAKSPLLMKDDRSYKEWCFEGCNTSLTLCESSVIKPTVFWDKLQGTKMNAWTSTSSTACQLVSYHATTRHYFKSLL